MRAFQVDHCGHPALGYLIVSRTNTGLKEEYKQLDKAALRDLAKSGVVLQSDPIENIEVAYTGDTCATGLVLNGLNGETDKSSLYKQQLFQADVILCELTYLDSTEKEEGTQRAADRGHIHICDLRRIFTSDAELDEKKSDEAEETLSKCITERQTQQIIFYHISGRSSTATRALDMIAVGLQRQLSSKCQVAISSILSNNEKNSLGRLIQPNGCISLIAYLAWRDRPK
jgi:hypothetical protein